MKSSKEMLKRIIAFLLISVFCMETLNAEASPLIWNRAEIRTSVPGLVPKGGDNTQIEVTKESLGDEVEPFTMPPAYKELLDEIYRGIFEKNFSSSGTYSNYTEFDLKYAVMSDSAKKYFLTKMEDHGQGGLDLTQTLYALRDLDEDGIPELLLTAADHNVDCIYTQIGDTVDLAAEFAYRNEANIYGRNIISEGSSGAEYGVSLLTLDQKTHSIQWLKSMTIRYGVENTYILKPNTPNQEVVSEERYIQQLEAWKSGAEPEWKELSQLFTRSEDALTGTVYGFQMEENVSIPFTLFESPTSEYNPTLAEFAILLAQSSYDNMDAHEDPDSYYIASTFRSLGFHDENIALYGYFENAPYSKDVQGILRDDTFGFAIGHREINGKILLIVAIRGSHSNVDWWKDIAGAMLADELMDLNVHTGFYQFYGDLQRGLKSYFAEHPELLVAMQTDCMKILVAGHSLGGAAANVLGASIGNLKECPWIYPYWNAHDHTYVYTFASPRTFNTLLGRKTTAGECDNIFNVAIVNDPVTMVPTDTELKHGGDLFSDMWYRFGWRVVYDDPLNWMIPLPVSIESHMVKQYLNAVRTQEPKQTIGQWSVIQNMMCSH